MAMTDELRDERWERNTLTGLRVKVCLVEILNNLLERLA